jgi:preprotein translocase subunit YajC
MTLATGAAADAGAGGGGLSLLILALPLLLLFYLMFSQRRRARRLAEAQEAVQVGEEVMTTAGMHGVVRAIEDGVVHLQIAEGVVVRHERRAIVPVARTEPGAGTR